MIGERADGIDVSRGKSDPTVTAQQRAANGRVR
jgi:hypothetical protein